jgi:hypothetical protein
MNRLPARLRRLRPDDASGQVLLWTVGVVAALSLVAASALAFVVHARQSVILQEALAEDVVVARAVALDTLAQGAQPTQELQTPPGSLAAAFGDVVYCSSLEGGRWQPQVSVTVTTTTSVGAQTLQVTAAPRVVGGALDLVGWSQSIGGPPCSQGSQYGSGSCPTGQYDPDHDGDCGDDRGH